MIRGLWHLALRLQDELLACLFVVAIALATFGVGAFVGHFRVFPYEIMSEAVQGVRAIVRDVTDTPAGLDRLERRVSEFPASEVVAHRIRNPEELTAGMLWPGGEGMFREYCPERGCLAVEFSPAGDVVRAYPYRLDELDDWGKIVELPRGTAHPVQSPELFPMPHAVRMYSNGDLLITFTYRNGVPGRGSIARIDRDGRPVWVRSDYSHHWPTIFKTSDGHESALVPGATIEDVPIVDRLGRKAPSFDTDCDDLNIVDHVLLMNGAGEVQQDIRLVDGILESPFAAMLYHSTYPCDLLQNYIDRIREDVRGIPGVVPGDYVVSLRHISAFGIVDSQTGDVKRLVRGTFIYQHSVQHLSGSEFLLFDNDGADVEAGPSRVLLVDLADGAVCQGRADNRPLGRRESVPLGSQVVSNNVRSE